MEDSAEKKGYTNAEEGLDSAAIKERIKQGLTNKKPSDNEYTTASIVRKNVFTYFNFIFFAFAIILIIEGSFNQLMFLGVIFTNIVIGIIQEIRSRRALDKLNIMSGESACVVRSGIAMRINSSDLVQDDIVELESGCQVPADAVVCRGEIYVNESLLTGEADEVKKTAGDKLLSGSFVISGKCRARLTEVGCEAFSARLMTEAKMAKKRQRPGMMKSLNMLIIAIGIIIVPFSVIMFWNQHFTLGISVKESVENTVASSIGMIPEGLYLLTSIALAASTVRLAKSKTIVHDMKCIESLARADVICVDKTGTITEPDMKVVKIEDISDGEISIEKLASLAFGMETENTTLSAVKGYFNENNIRPTDKINRKKEFSSVFKYSAAQLQGGEVYFFGAPDVLLRDRLGEYKEQLEEYFEAGERVLLFASASQAYSDAVFSDSAYTGAVVPLAFIVLSNPIRENAKKTFEYFASQGVAVKVISGDNPKAVSAVAKKAGIENADNFIDLSAVSDEEILSEKMLDYAVFGRVSPEQKRLLVKSLKRAGHTVAMTGDGVNDVLALKDADCSIAMASGSDAASNVADLVLANSDFANMPKVVDEGRRVINNIERSASLFLVKNVFSFILTLISIFTVSAYPLKPVQISLASAMMIGLPSFFLALEPNKSLVKGKFLRNVLYNALPSGITAAVLVEFAMLIAEEFNIGYPMLSTISCFVYSFSGYMMLLKVCRPFNVRRSVLFGAMGGVYIACVIAVPWFFDISSLNTGCVLIAILLIFPIYPMQKGIERIFELFKRKNKEDNV